MSRKILLDKINVPGIKTYEVYRREGGYASVEKALKKMTPDEVVEGQGGAYHSEVHVPSALRVVLVKSLF